MAAGRKIILTQDQGDWLVKHFHNTPNDEIAEHLGISMSSVARFARKLELKKSKAYLDRRNREAVAAAKFVNNKYGLYPQKGVYSDNLQKGAAYQFKPGHKEDPKMTKARARKAGATRRARIIDERWRVAHGLPQLTRMHVINVGQEVRAQRWYLKKRGYTLDGNVAYYDGDTLRASRLERRANSYWTFKQLR